MPPISASDLEWIYQRDGAEPALCLATITGPETGPFRLVRNAEDIVSRGNVFSAAWFDVEEPADNDGQPVTRFVFPNVDRQIGLILMESTQGLVVHFEWVRASDPDTVKYNLRQLKLRNVRITPVTIEGELSPAQYEIESYQPVRILPNAFPGLCKLRT